jgi:hypothetical protein
MTKRDCDYYAKVCYEILTAVNSMTAILCNVIRYSRWLPCHKPFVSVDGSLGINMMPKLREVVNRILVTAPQ